MAIDRAQYFALGDNSLPLTTMSLNAVDKAGYFSGFPAAYGCQSITVAAPRTLPADTLNRNGRVQHTITVNPSNYTGSVTWTVTPSSAQSYLRVGANQRTADVTNPTMFNSSNSNYITVASQDGSCTTHFHPLTGAGVTPPASSAPAATPPASTRTTPPTYTQGRGVPTFQFSR